MRFRNKHNGNEENFWLSATDMMAGILVVVLLLMLLFLLYLNQSKDEVYTPLDATEFKQPGETHAHDYEFIEPGSEHYEPTEEQQDEQQNQQGQGGTEAQEIPTQPPTEQRRRGFDDGSDDRSAVFVTVVDADSGNVIKKKGVRFELLAYKNGIGGLQTLNSYYQEIIEYKEFETGENGTFYLPEKITKGWYSLHNLSAPEGYYIDENTDFEINENWDWSEPYMVTVPMTPIKKTVRVSAEDHETSQGVAGVKLNVIASGDIKSADGSIRYTAGEVADEIITDDTGFAESKELYIGQYYIKQVEVPEYYAVDQKAVSSSVTETSSADTGLVKIDCYKTAVTVRLTDERTEEPIKGAVYSMEGRDNLATDENGEITISELKKSAVYTLTCSSVPDGYNKKSTELSFKVDSSGLVNGKTSAVVDDTAYTICLTVETKDRIFGRTSKGIDLQLLDENGTVIDEWTTNDSKYIVSGLKEGKYFIRRSDDDGSRVSVNVADTSELQTVQMRIWDTIDLFALLIAVGAVAIIGLIIGFIISRRKKVNHSHEK